VVQRQVEPTPRHVASDWILSLSKWIHLRGLVSSISLKNHDIFPQVLRRVFCYLKMSNRRVHAV